MSPSTLPLFRPRRWHLRDRNELERLQQIYNGLQKPDVPNNEDSTCKILNLPAELLLQIRDSLPPSSKAAFALSSRTAAAVFGTQVWTDLRERKFIHERHRFGRMMERDYPNALYCYRCKKIHWTSLREPAHLDRYYPTSYLVRLMKYEMEEVQKVLLYLFGLTGRAGIACKHVIKLPTWQDWGFRPEMRSPLRQKMKADQYLVLESTRGGNQMRLYTVWYRTPGTGARLLQSMVPNMISYWSTSPTHSNPFGLSNFVSPSQLVRSPSPDAVILDDTPNSPSQWKTHSIPHRIEDMLDDVESSATALKERLLARQDRSRHLLDMLDTDVRAFRDSEKIEDRTLDLRIFRDELWHHELQIWESLSRSEGRF